MTFEEVVHIIPLGHEIDRAVAPFRKHKADRGHVLAIQSKGRYDREMFERQQYFTGKVEAALRDRGLEVRTWDVDLFDMQEVMRHVARLIRDEEGNRVNVNMSACGRLTSIGATLAGMAHGAAVYYVEADAYSASEDETLEHGLSVCTSGEVKFLDNFKLQLPDETAMKLLAELAAGEMDTDALLGFMVANRVGIFADAATLERRSRHEDQRYLTSLNKTYLDKLVLAGYVTKEMRGNRRVVRVTDAGRAMAAISGLAPSYNKNR